MRLSQRFGCVRGFWRVAWSPVNRARISRLPGTIRAPNDSFRRGPVAARMPEGRPREESRPMPTLLVVDDEPAILLAFRRAYRGADLDVLTAEAPAEGLALAESRRPDVIVLDMQLPGASGLDVYRQLR